MIANNIHMCQLCIKLTCLQIFFIRPHAPAIISQQGSDILTRISCMARIANAEKPPRKSASAKKTARVGRPRGNNRDARLEKILTVARKNFAEKGYEQTT